MPLDVPAELHGPQGGGGDGALGLVLLERRGVVGPDEGRALGPGARTPDDVARGRAIRRRHRLTPLVGLVLLASVVGLVHLHRLLVGAPRRPPRWPALLHRHCRGNRFAPGVAGRARLLQARTARQRASSVPGTAIVASPSWSASQARLVRWTASAGSNRLRTTTSRTPLTSPSAPDAQPDGVDHAEAGVGHQHDGVGGEQPKQVDGVAVVGLGGAHPARRLDQAHRPGDVAGPRPATSAARSATVNARAPQGPGGHRRGHRRRIPPPGRADRLGRLGRWPAPARRRRWWRGRRRGRRTGRACWRPPSGRRRRAPGPGAPSPRSCPPRCRSPPRTTSRAGRAGHVVTGGRRGQGPRPAGPPAVGVGRRQRHPQPAGALGHGGRADGRHPQPLGQQGRRARRAPAPRCPAPPGRSGCGWPGATRSTCRGQPGAEGGALGRSAPPPVRPARPAASAGLWAVVKM